MINIRKNIAIFTNKDFLVKPEDSEVLPACSGSTMLVVFEGKDSENSSELILETPICKSE